MRHRAARFSNWHSLLYAEGRRFESCLGRQMTDGTPLGRRCLRRSPESDLLGAAFVYMSARIARVFYRCPSAVLSISHSCAPGPASALPISRLPPQDSLPPSIPKAICLTTWLRQMAGCSPASWAAVFSVLCRRPSFRFFDPSDKIPRTSHERAYIGRNCASLSYGPTPRPRRFSRACA